MGVLVEPKYDSYVLEWVAVQFDAAEFSSLKRIFHNTGWVVQLDLTDNGAQARCTNMANGQLRQVSVPEGDWVVRSPHGYLWFMDESEFRSQFHQWEE